MYNMQIKDVISPQIVAHRSARKPISTHSEPVRRPCRHARRMPFLAVNKEDNTHTFEYT